MLIRYFHFIHTVHTVRTQKKKSKPLSPPLFRHHRPQRVERYRFIFAHTFPYSEDSQAIDKMPFQFYDPPQLRRGMRGLNESNWNPLIEGKTSDETETETESKHEEKVGWYGTYGPPRPPRYKISVPSIVPLTFSLSISLDDVIYRSIFRSVYGNHRR